jgi:hypothetical protein
MALGFLAGLGDKQTCGLTGPRAGFRELFEHHGWILYLDIWQSASQPKGRLLNQGAALQESFSS